MNISTSFCPQINETYLKWPATTPGQFAQVPCIPHLNGVFYDSSKYVYKYCRLNGTWSPKKNASMCVPLKHKTLEHMRGSSSPFDSISVLIYYTGYTLSIMSLVIALFILLKLKTLKCMRNTIHCHLISAFVFSDASWILFHLLFSNRSSVSFELHSVVPHKMLGCNLISIIYTYFYTSNFFWMFAEGILMYQMVSIGFAHKVLALRYFVLLGWGLPSIPIIAWTLTIYKSYGDVCLINRVKDRNDQIYIIPILIVLVINFVLFAMVFKLWIGKVCSSKASGNINYLKSFKGFLFLIPHLGIIYLITVYSLEVGSNGYYKNIFIPLLVSTQGFFVSLYCCFMNKEVRLAVKAEMKNMENRRKSSCTSTYLFPTTTTTDGSTTMPFLKRFSLVSSTSNRSAGKKRSSIEEEPEREPIELEREGMEQDLVELKLDTVSEVVTASSSRGEPSSNDATPVTSPAGAVLIDCCLDGIEFIDNNCNFQDNFCA